MNRQIRQLGSALLILFLVLFVQINNIQILQASKLANDPRNNRHAVHDFSSPRGTIQTAGGQIIANSVPVDDQYKYLRQYPQPELYAGLTGFFSFLYGTDGLERQYNKDLTGKTYALQNIGDLLTDRVRTNNVTITVDSKLQDLARDQLKGRRGSVVALDPSTGAVLAMYSNPTFDPNLLSSHNFTEVRNSYNALNSAKDKPMQPRSYEEVYPPGSTFKVVTASAVYDRKSELADKRYADARFIPLPNSDQLLRNFGDSSCGGRLPDLLRVSCNTGFAQIGMDLGGGPLAAEAEDYGFNNIPPLDLPGVVKSNFPTPDQFVRNLPRAAYSAIGQQNVSATPLEMALVAASVANGGVIMKPHVLKEVRDNHGDVVKGQPTGPWRRATSAETADEVKQLMINVVNSGTATGARIPGVQVAAKTGTAQTGRDTVHAWFIAFAPAENPKIAVSVILEDQPATDESTGGALAAPIAREMIKAALGVK